MRTRIVGISEIRTTFWKELFIDTSIPEEDIVYEPDRVETLYHEWRDPLFI
jgi:hypothetical protein